MKSFTESFIKDCLSGNRITQKRLFEELYSPMFRICMRYINNEADAEDCVMRAFMKAFQHLSKFRYENENSLFIWIKKIMVNESLMILRKRKNFILTIEEMTTEIPLAADALHRMDAEELNKAILNLPEGYRTVFNLNVVEGYDHKEIAVMLGISEGTSRSQLAKAKNKLRSMIDLTSMHYGKTGQ